MPEINTDKAHAITKRQHQASDPHKSVWVNANAGCGKTKVLTDRYLRLLLNRVEPEKILCITFTKAAAAEMKHRIIDKIRDWPTLSDSELKGELASLAIDTDDSTTLQTARRLFNRLLDKNHAINISTVHSFCQSLLGRFPLECGLVPYFSLAEENRAQQLLDTAIDSALTPSDAHSKQQKALQQLLDYVPHSAALKELLQKVTKERQRFQRFFNAYSDNINEKIAQTLNIHEDKSPLQYLREKWTQEQSDILASFLESHSDKANASEAKTWLGRSDEEKIQYISEIQNFFFTSGKLRKNLCKGIGSSAAEILETQASIITEIYEYLCALELYRINAAFLTIADNIITYYSHLKSSLGRLDYDDLILKACELLRDSADRQWVAYKLDGGIDHILVDEAQDTNPEQWDFIKALAESFFDNTGEINKNPRASLFVVGDEKQSIYRFQRADVRLFDETRHNFKNQAELVGLPWREVELATSFRSSENLLKFVDNVFEKGKAREGMGKASPHRHYHEALSGRIELIAPFVYDKQENAEQTQENSLEILRTRLSSDESKKQKKDTENKLAEALADKVNRLLSVGANAGDIMILLRKRGSLMNKIIAALQEKQIAVAGVDRLRLTDHIAAQDLLALADFCLLPTDDLTLAGLLRSPPIGLTDENTLYELCRGREETKQSLWDYLCSRSDDARLTAITEWLKRRMRDSVSLGVYAFFATALSDKPPLPDKQIINGSQAFSERLGLHVQEILEEFLDHAYRFRSDREHTGSLQEFLYEVRTRAQDIKREGSVRNLSEVRIMTIHAAKGLESEIVMLPDTISTRSRISADSAFDFWPDEAHPGIDIPLWIPKIKCALTDSLKLQNKALEDEEYHRLLYVAMTRAKSHLYIFGAMEKTGTWSGSSLQNCWYSLIAQGCGVSLEELEEAEEGTILFAGGEENFPKPAPQPPQETILPQWLISAPAAEPPRPRRIAASKASETEPIGRSPIVVRAEQKATEKGNLIHSLLQYLPDIAAEKRRQIGEQYLVKHAAAYSETERATWLAQTLKLMQEPDLQEIFSDKARAEVTVSGYVDDKLISGRIDRLLIKEDSVLIIDYKTSENTKSARSKYAKQMQAYETLLQQIYPDKTIKTAIVFTENTKLVPINYSD